MLRLSRFIVAGLFCLTAPVSFAQVQSELTELKAINTKLATQAGYLDGLEAGQAGFATAVNQVAIIGHIDGLESAIAALPQNNVLGAGTANIGDVDVLSSALPTGAATSAKQDTVIGHVDGLETAIAALPQNNVLGAGSAAIGKLGANSGVDIGDVDVTSSALPTGASTSAKQPAIGTAGVSATDVLSVQGIASGTALPASQSGTWTVQPGNTPNTTAWKVDGSAVTQPVSAASLPLPSGAATAAKQPALGTAGTPSSDVITVQGSGSGTALPVSVASIPSHAVTNAGTFAVQNSAATPAGTNNIGDVDVLTIPALVAGTANIGDIDVLSSALPTGAATSANQTTVIGHVDGIETAIAALPQNNVLGAGTANIGDIDVLSLPATPAGNNNIGDVDVASSALPTGAATSSLQTSLNALLPASLGSKADAASLAVTQSTEDKAALAALGTALASIITNTTAPYRSLCVDASNVACNLDPPATEGIVNTTMSTSSQEIIAARTDRMGLELQYLGTGYVYCRWGTSNATVSPGGFNFRLGTDLPVWEATLTVNGISNDEMNCIGSADVSGSLVGTEYRQ